MRLTLWLLTAGGMKNTLKWSVAANRVIQAPSRMPLPPLVLFFFLTFFPSLFQTFVSFKAMLLCPNPLDLFCKITAQTRSRSTSLRKKKTFETLRCAPRPPRGAPSFELPLFLMCVCVVFVVYMTSVGDAPPAGYTSLKCSQ